VWLTAHCLAWARPDWAEPPFTTNAKMEKGSRIHALIEDLHADGGLVIVEDKSELAAAKSAIGYMKLLDNIRLEVPIAWNWETGVARVLPSKGHRDYSDVKATEIPGTADLIAEKDRVLHVVDWKTGMSKWPNYGPQIRFLGMAAAVIARAADVETVIVKLSPTDAKVGERYALDLFDMAAEQERLAERMRGLATAEPRTGPHCNYCNSRGLCPAFQQQVAS
jgi:hypothetical protein